MQAEGSLPETTGLHGASGTTPPAAEVCLPHTQQAPSPGSQSAGADGVKGRLPEAPGQLLG